MELLVRNAEGNLNQQDREYAARKLGRLNRYFNRAQKVEIVHREEKNNHKPSHRLEVTVLADGFTIRGEEHDESVMAAIDKVSEKLENRLRKLKTRLIDSHRRRGTPIPESLEILPEEEGSTLEIASTKSFDLKPMSHAEAALQMEMLEHPFFVFRNEETNRIEVLYKRHDGKYGLLAPLY
jgi:putative sigma-54 modulation protein